MAFVDDRCVLVNLREKVAVEVRVSASVRIWQVDIGHAAAGQFVDLASVGFDPGIISQSLSHRP